ncbi:MAG: PorV/PorQ family protein [candidate division Zixibacteria bacterium]|nr:PorV/PorQ family protein [candidate division Zixibacteria bacterium]
MRVFQTIIYFAIVVIVSFNGIICECAKAVEYNAGVESIFSFGASARAMGMGGAFSAISNDAAAVYYNPAGITHLEQTELQGMHVSLWQDVNYDCVLLAVPSLNYGYFGLGVMRIGVDGIPRRDAYNIKRGDFGYHQEQYLLTYAFQLTENLRVGASGKISSQSLYNYSASGFSSDLGLLLRIPGLNQMTIGLNLQDLYSSPLKLKSETEKIPINLKAGFGYEFFFSGYSNRLVFAFDIDKSERKSMEPHLGVEADLQGRFFLRSGYEQTGVSFGGGLSLGFIGVDYAFLDNEYLGKAHRFSLSMKFGKPLSIRLREKIAREESISREKFAAFSRQEKLRNANYYLTQGDSLSSLGEFAAAERAYLNALAWDPEFSPASRRLRDINPELESLRDQERTGIRQNMEIEFILSKAKELAAAEDYNNAIQELNTALIINPENIEVSELKTEYEVLLQSRIRDIKVNAYSYYKQKDYTNAYNEYGKLLEISDEDPVARRRLNEISNKLRAAIHLKQGLQLYTDGNYSLSAAEFQLALKFDPDDQSSKEYLDRSQSMLTGVTTLEELRKNQVVWQYYLDGINAYQAGDFSRAIEEWGKVLQVYPTNSNTLRNVEQAQRLLEIGGDKE